MLPVLLLFAFAVKVQAQTTYPVQVNTHLLPPYSLYLSDYYSGTRDKLTLTLINRDQFKPTLNVRLRMTITAPGGVRLQTNDNAYVTPIIVRPARRCVSRRKISSRISVPTTLYHAGCFLTDGKLPEGMVQFCFQAIEAYTGRVLSASTCARAFITSQKPPLLMVLGPGPDERDARRVGLVILPHYVRLARAAVITETSKDYVMASRGERGAGTESPDVQGRCCRTAPAPLIV